MEIEYIREDSGTYLAIEDENHENFEMKMVKNNEIPGLLKITTRQINNRIKYLFSISGKCNLQENYARNNMGYEELVKLTEGLRLLLDGLNEYLLSGAGIVLEADKVYVDNNTGEFYFTYFKTAEEDNFFNKLKGFFEYIISIIDHTDNAAVTFGYGIYKKLCMNECSVDELFRVEYKEQNHPYEIITEEKIIPDVLPEIVEEEREEVDKVKLYAVYGIFGGLGLILLVALILLVRGKNKTIWGLLCIVTACGAYFLYKWYEKNKTNFIHIVKRETEIPYVQENVRVIMPRKDENLTVILKPQTENEHYIEWDETSIHRKYPIKDTTIIGSSTDGKADCVIRESGISRVHAKIIKEDDSFFVKDLNSTNGTMVNGEMLAAYQMLKINTGDTIQIGGISLLFH